MSVSVNTHCQICDQLGHSAFQCFKKARKPMTTMRRLKKNGKHHRLWQQAKRKWYKANDRKYYSCYICSKVMPRNETTLDHIKSRGRHPELRYELSNLAPCCWKCNTDKGSRDITEI